MYNEPDHNTIDSNEYNIVTVCKDDRLNASVIEKHLIPPSIAFCLSEEGAYTEDLVNDKRAFKFLKIQDQALKHLRKKFPDAFRMLRAFC